jgi:hypothetical protein
MPDEPVSPRLKALEECDRLELAISLARAELEKIDGGFLILLGDQLFSEGMIANTTKLAHVHCRIDLALNMLRNAEIGMPAVPVDPGKM